MKDADARKEIKDLREQVFVLESKLLGLEHELKKQTNLSVSVNWDYFKGNIYGYKFPTRDVLKLLLENLGLEAYTITQKEMISLRKTEGKNVLG